MNILTFTDFIAILPTIDAIALAWDGRWPEDADHIVASESPGTLVVERSGWKGEWRGGTEDDIYEHVTIECSDGQETFSASFTDATADEVVDMLSARYRSIHKA